MPAEHLAPHNGEPDGFPTWSSDFNVLNSYFHKKWNYEFAIKCPKTIRQAMRVYTKTVRKTKAAERRKPFAEVHQTPERVRKGYGKSRGPPETSRGVRKGGKGYGKEGKGPERGGKG